MSEPITAITWSDSHRIGVEEIDREHEWLIADFNSVVNALRTIKDRRLIVKMFDVFVRATAGHFANEEAAMEQVEFDDLEVHRERHQNYLRRLDILRDKLLAGADITNDLRSFFASWTTHHVAVTDRKFGDFLKRRG